MANKALIIEDYQKTGSYAQTGRNLGISRQRAEQAVNKKYLAYRNEKNRELRQQGITKLGGKCIKCGFSDIRALQFDHINGGGKRELKRTGTMTRYIAVLKDNGTKYQLLCANCNWIKKYDNNEK